MRHQPARAEASLTNAGVTPYLVESSISAASLSKTKLPAVPLAAVADFDIAGPDLDALGDFDRSVLGWEPLPQGPGYTLLRTPADGPNGTLNEADAPAVAIGVPVDDLDQAVAGATASGCSVDNNSTSARDAECRFVAARAVRSPAAASARRRP